MPAPKDPKKYQQWIARLKSSHLGKTPWNKGLTGKTDTRILHSNNHWHWNGGKRLTPQGYVLVMVKNHPFARCHGYVREHRLVMEKWLRKHDPNHKALVEINGVKYLKTQRMGWVVHHKNDIRDDNRIENLELMTPANHIKHHHKNKIVSKETRIKLSLTHKGVKHTPEAKIKMKRYLHLLPKIIKLKENGWNFNQIRKKLKVTHYVVKNYYENREELKNVK